jgi:hypothetical protein
MYLFRVTVRKSNKETTCAHETSHDNLNLGQLMNCSVTYATR